MGSYARCASFYACAPLTSAKPLARCACAANAKFALTIGADGVVLFIFPCISLSFARADGGLWHVLRDLCDSIESAAFSFGSRFWRWVRFVGGADLKCFQGQLQQ